MGLVSNQEQHKSIFSPKKDETKHTKTRYKWKGDIKE